MNDLPLHIDNNIYMFANDSTMYTSGHNVDEIQHSLQTNLNAVTTWCEDNRMVTKNGIPRRLTNRIYRNKRPRLSGV